MKTASMTVDCETCSARNAGVCGDCVVSFLLERDPFDAVIIDVAEARALRLLEDAGLVPSLRFNSEVG
jgi:hypothetical protein